MRRLLLSLLAAFCSGRILAVEPQAGLTARPLAAPAARASATLFEAIPAAQSGVTAVNRYDDPRMWTDRWLEFSNGAVATGVTIGDFDGDGLPDLYVLCRTGPNHLYRNLGNFRFEDVTERAGVGGRTGGPWVNSATCVDLNGDGRLDLYVCYHGAPNQLFINQGDGTFTEQAARYGLAVTTDSVAAAFADYDRDGRLDLFLLTNRLDVRQRKGEPDYLFHQDADGVFHDVSAAAGLARADEFQGFAGLWWDPLGQGWPDLYVANDFEGPDRFYRNNRDGSFRNVLDTSAPSTSFSAMGADSGDIDNDGRPDLFVADMLPARHGRLLVYSTLDTDEPGRRFDLPVPQLSKNTLWLNQGDGHFAELAYATGVAATDWSWSPLFGDLDNDGWLDLHVTNGMIRDFMDADAQLAQGQYPGVPAVFWKTQSELRERGYTFRNTHDLHFANVSKAWGLDRPGISFGSALVDLDRDGRLDLVVSNYNAPPTLYWNNGQTGHAILVQFQSDAPGNRLGVGATVNLRTSQGRLTRTLTLSRGLASCQPHELHFGLGADTIIAEMEVRWPSGRRQVFPNLPADQLYVVTEPTGPLAASVPADPNPSPIFREAAADYGLQFTHGGRDVSHAELKSQPLLPARLTRLGPGLAWADVDGDGQADVIVSGGLDHAGAYFATGSAPTQAPPFVTAEPQENLMPLVFEANGDSHPDVLLTTNAFSDTMRAPTPPTIRLWLGTAPGTFTPAPPASLPSFAGTPGVVCAADFDQDGDLDLFVGGRCLPGRYPEALSSALWENRHGKFVDVTAARALALLNVGLVTGAVWADVNNDGRPDLMIVREWGAPLYLMNTAEGFIDRSNEVGVAELSGWWNSVVAVDLNGDGRMDFVLGNAGQNTPYQATPAEPALLLTGNFGGTGETNLVEARFENGLLRPWRNAVQLARGLRSPRFTAQLRRRFPTFASYAAAPLEAILSPQALAECQIYSASTLDSGVLMQDSAGRFSWRPLPLPAQWGPVHGIVAADFDGDGQIDLALSQNSSRPMPYAGRFTGGVGVVLLGNGRGDFVPQRSAQSGFLISGDGRALATGDLNRDGWPDLLAAQNTSPLLAFVNQPTASHHSFAVMLHGPPGNPSAIGARVTALWPDGRQCVAEVQAGGSYLSQSSPAVFFGYANDPPTLLTVRWPGGAVTRHPWQERATLSIAVPH